MQLLQLQTSIFFKSQLHFYHKQQLFLGFKRFEKPLEVVKDEDPVGDIYKLPSQFTRKATEEMCNSLRLEDTRTGPGRRCGFVLCRGCSPATISQDTGDHGDKRQAGVELGILSTLQNILASADNNHNEAEFLSSSTLNNFKDIFIFFNTKCHVRLLCLPLGLLDV